MSSDRIRLDQFLTKHGHAASRSRARDMVLRQCVFVDGILVTKASLLVSPDQSIEVSDPAAQYVSRAAMKLKKALEDTQFDPMDTMALDLGASTGGFTQVLLEGGARSVIAVDVGHGQMHEQIRRDPRVSLYENLNARTLDASFFNDRLPNFVVSDLSFVSLTIAAEPALMCCAEKAKAILLVKPQFEVGKDGIGKGGLVTDDNLIDETNTRLRQWFSKLPGWRETHFLNSPITGGDGNREFLLCGIRS